MSRSPSTFAASGLASRSPWGAGWRLSFLAAAVLLAFPCGSLAQSPDSASVVRGEVREHETGDPLAGAAVSLASGPGGTAGIGTRVTDRNGRFLFRRVPAGTYRVVVTLLGYGDLRDTLSVASEAELNLVLPMAVSPVELEALVVVAEARPLGPIGDFQRRRERFSGTFFDREDIEERNPMRFTDLFRMVPGARVLPVGPYDYTIRLRGGCRPTMWLDGARLITAEGADHMLPVMDLEAVEVYHAGSTPVEFGAGSCGAIVVWTRRGERVEGEGSFWRRLAVAAGFLTLAFILAN